MRKTLLQEKGGDQLVRQLLPETCPGYPNNVALAPRATPLRPQTNCNDTIIGAAYLTTQTMRTAKSYDTCPTSSFRFLTCRKLLHIHQVARTPSQSRVPGCIYTQSHITHMRHIYCRTNSSKMTTALQLPNDLRSGCAVHYTPASGMPTCRPTVHHFCGPATQKLATGPEGSCPHHRTNRLPKARTPMACTLCKTRPLR